MSELAFRKSRRASRISLAHRRRFAQTRHGYAATRHVERILTGMPRKWLKRPLCPRRSLMIYNKRRWRLLRILERKASLLVSSFSLRVLERRGFPRLTAIGRSFAA